MTTTMTVIVFLLIVVVFMNTAIVIQTRKAMEQKVRNTSSKVNITYKQVLKDEDDGRFRLAPLDDLDEEYINMFSNPLMDRAASQGKSAYLRNEYHDKIRRLVNDLNIEDVNVSTYVDMVLTEHFRRYDKQIRRLQKNIHAGQEKNGIA